ncbi:AfsR/SARP family transcriptional regulator [Herbidospora mongoliensis]|uniref:AfsR/SARP family transcriptional regulator n=1 Tax=Herbidospora mongoliensis TaxID=688067 RepID=UPI00082EC021|nr:AfsR/SARP family transcriptional regulator [Herbidospora mongoliensis]
MRFQVLGQVEVLDVEIGSGPAQLGGQKQRALLALLLAAGGRIVSVSRLVDELWGEEPPPKVLSSVQAYISNLRRALEPDRPARAPARILLTRPPGYALTAENLDAAAFERLVGEAQKILTTDPAHALDLLRSAGELWRGEPYEDVAAMAPGLAAEAARLTEVWLLATEDRFRAELALGVHNRLVGEIERMVTAHPLREAGWGLLAVALYRSQRQGEALDALRRARQVLADELGVDPGPELRRLEAAVLNHEPSLDAMPAPAKAVLVPVPPVAATGLVGRDDWLARLTGHLVDTSAGRGTLVLVTGEPGVGKTGLARALTATAAAMGLRTGWGRCEETAGAPALWPWSQALAPLAEASATGQWLPGWDGTAADLDTVAFRLAEATAALLRETGPALLVLDDLHWADGDTLHLVRRLGAMLATLPVVLLLTSRDAEADLSPELAEALADLARADLVRVGLRGLDQAGVRDYVALRHGVEIPDEVAAALRERTNGNPFFIGELVQLLAEERRLTDPEAPGALRVPDGVRDVVRRRIDQLPDDVEPLLSTAAVYGRTFDADLVEAASGLTGEAALTATEAALLAGLIEEEGDGHRFTHALVREAIYARLSPGRRRLLHAALAGEIEARSGRVRETRLTELAHHYGRAAAEHARAAWTYATRASAVAALQPAPAEAARLQEAALSALSRDRTATDADRYEVLLGLALARKRAGYERQAWESAREAAEVALAGGDVVAAARAAVTTTTDAIWSWREYQVVDVAATALFERLARELPAGHEALRARLLAALAGEIYYGADTADRSVALSTEAEALARAHGTRDDLARVLELRHVAYERPQLLDERLAASRELVEMAESADDPAAQARALVFRGRDQIEHGDVGAGLRHYRDARELAERHALAPALVVLTWADAIVAVARGRFEEAEQAIADAREFHSGTTVPGAAEIPIALTATLNLARGTLPAIEPLLAEAAAATGLSLLRDWHALALVRSNRTEQARTALGPWRQQPEVPRNYMWLTHMAIRAELWSALASPDAAHDLYADLAPYAGRIVIGGTGITFAGFAAHHVGLLARARGDLDTALDHLRAALRDNEESGFRPFAAATARELAATLQSRK